MDEQIIYNVDILTQTRFVEIYKSEPNRKN